MPLKTILLGSVLIGMLLSITGRAGQVSLTAIGWILPLFVASFILALNNRVPARFFLLWLPWVFLIIVAGAISPFDNSIVRSFIIATPIFVGWAASGLSYSDHDMAFTLRSIKLAAIFILGIIILKVFIFSTYESNRLPTESIAAVAVGWVLYIHWRLKKDKSSLALFLGMLSIPIIATSRGPTLALITAVFLSAPYIRISRMFMRILIAACLLVFAVFLYPPIAEKMVHSGDSITDIASSPEIIQTSGRLVAWERLLEGIADHPMIGHGANASEMFLVSEVSESFSHPHNDYLRILYDYGLIGLLIFLATLFTQYKRVGFSTKNSSSLYKSIVAYAAISLFIPYALLMSVDNIFLYAAFFGNLHFFLIGCTESRSNRLLDNRQS